MDSLARGVVGRRGFLALPVAGIAVASAGAAIAGAAIHSFKGRYAVDGHRIVDGFFAAPRTGSMLDVVLVIPASGALDATAEATARSYAADGWLAIAPNLPATYRDAAPFGKSAMVAALMQDVSRFQRLTRTNGRVTVIAA